MRIPFEVLALQVHPEIGCIGKQLVLLLWKEKHKNVTLTQFWANVQSVEPNLSELCLQTTNTLLPFRTTYLCDAGFSALAVIKTKNRNQLQPEDDIRCTLMTIKPQFRQTC